jgi:hypothetical protein
MNRIILFGLMGFSGLLISCNSGTTTTESDSAASTTSATYACPMHPEVTSDKPEICRKCGMNLVPIDRTSATEKKYNMQLAVTPSTPESGQSARLTFRPTLKGNTQAQVPLDEVHTKKIHLIVASSDLSWYDHIHPEFQADGSYVVDETFPSGGEFILFADYTPSGGGNQVQRFTVKATGTSKPPATFDRQNLTTQSDGYAVTLKPAAGKFLTNNNNHIGVEVTEKGAPVTQFENVMGAKGHLVIISGDGQHYLHVHPDEVNGVLDLHTWFDHPGIYRAFYQFQTGGKLRTAAFTLDVTEGKEGELEGYHDHGDGDFHKH